jgi:hypothetical protein
MKPSAQDLIVLGAIALIRTVISLSLNAELPPILKDRALTVRIQSTARHCSKNQDGRRRRRALTGVPRHAGTSPAKSLGGRKSE